MGDTTWAVVDDRLSSKITGTDALQSSIETMITTALAGFDIYSWDFGSQLLNILDEGSDYIEAKACDFITSCLVFDDRIDSVKDFYIEKTSDSMTISFVVVTCYGEIESEVVV